ncbi:MAG: glycosyltransferase [Candidatus Eisenbacteria bacterium]|nr:glycosyltransferase [Candidatus Latescibacterota bacterium]MBD3302817.1 glycosyltransferase [Candidatus Eisenbacteria bacterium]
MPRASTSGLPRSPSADPRPPPHLYPTAGFRFREDPAWFDPAGGGCYLPRARDRPDRTVRSGILRVSMRVLHVVADYPTRARPHAQVFVRNQVDSLVAAGVACDVLILRGRSLLKYATGWLQVQSRLRRGAFDLLHAHYAYCGLVSLGHGIPLVTSLLGSDLVGFARRDGSYPALSRVAHRRLARHVAGRSDACIVKSRAMRDRLGLPVHVVPNGVDLDRFEPVDAETRVRLRDELGLPQEAILVLFAGNPRVALKRFPLAEAAVRTAEPRVPRPLHLVPISGRSQDDVVRHMQACDLLLLTSSQEGSPNVVKEAMAAGMAVVAVDVGDTRERLAGVPGCRVTADDRPETIAAALADVITSEESRGGRAAVEPLRIEKVAARIMEIYGEALARRSPAGRG